MSTGQTYSLVTPPPFATDILAQLQSKIHEVFALVKDLKKMVKVKAFVHTEDVDTSDTAG